MTAPGSAPVSGTAAAEAVLAVLVEHRDDMESGDYGEVLWSGCICGDEHPYDEHDQHVADQIVARLAAGLLADPDATETAAAQAELTATTRARIAEHKPILDRLAEQEEHVSFLGSDEAAARFVAAVSWPLERQENRDHWALRLLTDDDLLNREAWQARARLQAAIDRLRAVRDTAEPGETP